MRKSFIFVLLLPLIFLTACSLKKAAPDYNPPTNINPPGQNNPVACTMEAKLCPDGSAVGRSGPNCEFSPCPETNLNPATTSVKVFFGIRNLNPNSIDCNKVYAVERIIQLSDDAPNAALRELFKGPNQSEKENGYTSWFSDKTTDILKDIKVTNVLARVDLVDIRSLIPNASTSCGSAELLAEMETTLKQFPEIKKVIISIDGQPDTFYQWLQLSTPVFKY